MERLRKKELLRKSRDGADSRVKVSSFLELLLPYFSGCSSQTTFPHALGDGTSMLQVMEQKWKQDPKLGTVIYKTQSAAAAAAKSLQSCPTLCDPIDGSPPGSPIPGILQARTLEGVAISFPNA